MGLQECSFDQFCLKHGVCQGKLPRVLWVAGYGLKLLDIIGSLQQHTARGPYIPYQEVTLALQAKEMGPPT
jgi:hypothetical protein